MSELKKPIIFFVSLAIFWFAFSIYLKNVNTSQENKVSSIKVGGAVFVVEVVAAQDKLKKGLGGRKELCDSCGMLFQFSQPGKYSFWMKDMLIPLDIVWISQEKIVQIEKNIQPDFKGTLVPFENADKVLEIKAGKSDELGIKLGDFMNF